MADPDISGMPDPTEIGLKGADLTAGMPDPEDIYRKFYFGGGIPNANGKMGPLEPIPKDALDEFMANPPKPTTARDIASRATGLPRAAAGAALAVPAGVASVVGQGTGALGAALDPENAGTHLEQGRERGREWAARVGNLANYIPATKQGGEIAADLLNAPVGLTKETVGAGLKKVLPDNAYQAVNDVAQDVATDLPALGAPGYVRAGARAVGAGVRGTKNFVKGEAATVTPPEPPPADALAPPVGKPVTGDQLRAQPNPIPPPEAPTAAAEPPAATPTQPTTEPPAAQPPPNAAAGTPSPGDTQRGSVRLFNSPKEEGPKETPAPAEQAERQGHLDAIDRLSGGQLPTRRTSALTGDYNATGDDWQMKESGNETMQKQVASENAALHAAADNVHSSVGSEFDDSVDPHTLGERGRVTRGAIHGIQDWFQNATNGIYNTAREQNQGRPIAQLGRVKAYLDDDSNFTNDAEIGLQRAAKQRLDRLWTSGDPDKGVPPGSVNAAERFREFLNEKGKNPNAMGVANELKGHVDMDVAEHGGPGLFAMARALRRHQYQMLEEPTGIKKLLAPGDSQGINHAIPEHKVMDYIAELPREQHEHVLNVLRAGAHLGDGELAESSAAAIREIQAHMLSRLHDAATDDGGKWNARSFYNAASRYGRNASATFADRPDVLTNLKTINDAGNTLHMDKHYPGAAAQTVRSGILAGATKVAGAGISSVAHEIPLAGRLIGRAIERATEAATGEMGKRSTEKAAAQKIVDRTGKQRGAVGDLSQRDAIQHESRPDEEGTLHRYKVPDKGGGMSVMERPGLGVSQVQTANVNNKGQGWGTRMLQRAADDAHARGQVLRSDQQVSHGQAGAYKNLAQLGYDVKMKPNDNRGGAYHAVGDHVFEVRPRKPGAPVRAGATRKTRRG